VQPHATVRENHIELEFSEQDQISSFFEAALGQNGFFLTLPHELKMFQAVELSVPAVGFSFKAEVIQLFPAAPGSVGTALQLIGWDRKKQQELARSLSTEPSAAAGADSELPTIFQLRDMDVTQRIRLAMKAGRPERQLLVRDNSPQVLTALLANPRLEDEEVLQIVQSPYTSSGVVQQIASSQRWSSSYEIQLAVVRSPKTPLPLVLRLLESLRTKDLGVLAKSSAVRDNVKKAALRVYLKRSSAR
jgi:hypothetical protein